MKYSVFASFFSVVLLAQVSQPRQRPVAPVERPSYKPEELCRVEGVVRNAATGEPLRRADITLMGIGTSSANAPSNPATTTTDGDGKFAMVQIEPGKYRLMASRAGFIQAQYGARTANSPGTTITLDKGQAVGDLEIKLAPHAVVAGRITEEDGEPVMHASVQLLQSRMIQNRRQWVPTGFSQTNDLGEYRIFGVAGGRYLLSAASTRGRPNSGHDRSANPVPEENFVATYYPGTVDMSTASPIKVTAGARMSGVDFTLRKARTYRVTGRVSGVTETGVVRGGGIQLIPRASVEAMISSRSTGTWRGPKGEFEVRGVRPGSYVVRTDYFESPDIRLSGTATVEVMDRDVDDVVLRLVPPVEITGTIRVEGTTEIKLQEVTVAMEPRSGGFNGGSASTRADEKGSFRLQPAGADDYGVRAMGMPSEYYLKSARSGDIDVLKDGLDFSRSTSSVSLDLVLSPTAAQLDGGVTDEKGNAVSGAFVVLRSTAIGTLAHTLSHQTFTDENGRFKIPGITPGEYQLIAIEPNEETDPSDPEFLVQYQSKAEKVRLAESAKETRQVKAVKDGEPAR